MSENHAEASTETKKLRLRENKPSGEEVARDLSLEFKENRQQAAPASQDRKRVTFRLDADDPMEAGKSPAGVLGPSSFESPRRKEREEFM